MPTGSRSQPAGSSSARGPRRSFPGSALLPALLLLLGGCGAGEESGPDLEAGGESPSSLVLIVVDTLRRDHLSLHGYPHQTSPALDGLARECVVFQRCRSASSWTQPATATLLTGLYPARHGAQEYAVVEEGVEFLAERLRDEGYATGGFSGNPNVSPVFAMDQGFDHFEFLGGGLAKEYPDLTELIERADAWQQQQDGPFFLYLHVMNVHGPYRAPEEFRQRFLEQPFEEFEFQCDLWRDILREAKVERRADVTEGHLRDLTARYDGAIAYSDRVLGEWLEQLRGRGVLDESLLVVTSDHGEELFDHGGFGHGFTLYAEVLDVPLLVRLPGTRPAFAGTAVEEPSGLVDLPATILDVLGLLPDEAAGRFGDGHSLRPLWESADSPSPRPYLAQVERQQGASLLLEEWPWRVLDVESDYARGPPRVELYRADDDPAETRDLAGVDPERLRDLLDRARRRTEELEAAGFDTLNQELSPELREQLESLGYATRSAGQKEGEDADRDGR